MIQVLLVDDHTIFRSGLKRLFLDEPDLRIAAEARNGIEALERIRNSQFSIVVLDINLEGRSGLEVLVSMRAEAPRLPVLMLSMYPEQQYALVATQSGANGYVSKDAEPGELLLAIRRVAAGGQYLSKEAAPAVRMQLNGRDARPAHQRLTVREHQIMLMIVKGKSLTEIGEEMLISVKTVSTHRTNILGKLGLAGNAELVLYAVRQGIIHRGALTNRWPRPGRLHWLPMTEVSLPVAPPQAPALSWRNRFASLGERFYSVLPADPVPDPQWVAVSPSCARELGLPEDWWRREEWRALDVFSGNATWPGMRPLASVYSGHQFGVWAGQLGDGRALWLGEVQTDSGPLEVQLKGSGRTPYARMGDGRAVLRSSIREFLVSEAMHALGIPTTRALCVIASPLPVRREEIESAAVVTRVAPSFIRFGHFEHFAHQLGPDDGYRTLRQLADFVIDHHAPECRDAANPYAALLERTTRRTAELMAQWQAVGFCHGVMNTDNMSILGLTIDYGPYGFLDAFDPGHICNHSDHQGRYAYARQPNIGFWNLHALAQALLPLIGEGDDASDIALAALEPYKSVFPHALLARMSAKLGLAASEPDDRELIDGLLKLMAADRVDFTITFRRLAAFRTTDDDNSSVRDLFIDRVAFDAWAARYAARLLREASLDAARAERMNRVNPKYVLRNHLVETAIQRARDGDYEETRRLLKVLERPFDEQSDHAAYADFPPEWAQTIEVSCSS